MYHCETLANTGIVWEFHSKDNNKWLVQRIDMQEIEPSVCMTLQQVIDSVFLKEYSGISDEDMVLAGQCMKRLSINEANQYSFLLSAVLPRALALELIEKTTNAIALKQSISNDSAALFSQQDKLSPVDEEKITAQLVSLVQSMSIEDKQSLLDTLSKKSAARPKLI